MHSNYVHKQANYAQSSEFTAGLCQLLSATVPYRLANLPLFLLVTSTFIQFQRLY